MHEPHLPAEPIEPNRHSHHQQKHGPDAELQPAARRGGFVHGNMITGQWCKAKQSSRAWVNGLPTLKEEGLFVAQTDKRL